MKRIQALRRVVRCGPTSVVASLVIVALATSCGHNANPELYSVSKTAPSTGAAAPVYGIRIPRGYRDWTLISLARVGPPVSDLRAKLGNDVAIRAYRAGTRPFPDGTVIARLAYTQATSEEGNKAVGSAAAARGLSPEAVQKLLNESFVAGEPTSVQFMVKDSKRYASTDGWGFAEFINGQPSNEAEHRTCFACHAPAKDRDFVFTTYSR